MGAVHDRTGSYALGFIVLSTLAAFCLALLLARVNAQEPAPER
jgi:cyanate permease